MADREVPVAGSYGSSNSGSQRDPTVPPHHGRPRRPHRGRDLGTDYAAALAAYEATEAEHRGDSNYDIVLVGSDSLETVKLTHGSYFAAYEEDLREAVRREITALGAGM